MSKVKHLLIEKKLTQVDRVIDEDDFYLEGIFLQSNIINGNNRFYPVDIMENAVEVYRKEYIENGNAVGALDHPEDPTLKLVDVSHIFVELKQQGTDWIGKARVGNTPKGLIVKELVKMGTKIGTSSRAGGSVDEGMGPGGSDLVTSLEFITVGDFVATPSAPNAFLDQVMESKIWIFENNNWIKKSISEERKKIHKTSRINLSEQKKESVIKIFNTINKYLQK